MKFQATITTLNVRRGRGGPPACSCACTGPCTRLAHRRSAKKLMGAQQAGAPVAWLLLTDASVSLCAQPRLPTLPCQALLALTLAVQLNAACLEQAAPVVYTIIMFCAKVALGFGPTKRGAGIKEIIARTLHALTDSVRYQPRCLAGAVRKVCGALCLGGGVSVWFGVRRRSKTASARPPQAAWTAHLVCVPPALLVLI